MSTPTKRWESDVSPTLQDINVVELQTLQAALYGVEDMLAAESPLVDESDLVRVQAFCDDICSRVMSTWLVHLRVVKSQSRV